MSWQVQASSMGMATTTRPSPLSARRFANTSNTLSSQMALLERGVTIVDTTTLSPIAAKAVTFAHRATRGAWWRRRPKRQRYFMQRDGAVLNIVLRIFPRVIAQSLSSNCPSAASVKAALHIGAVTFIHRFGSSLNGHVHFHVCIVDGV